MHTDISLFCWKLHRGLKAEKVHLCVFTCASLSHRAAVAFTFDLPWRRISLTLCKCVSVTAVGVLVESLQNGVPSRGPFVCCFDYEQAISPRGWMASTLGLQQVRGCIFVCVRECIHKCRESERRWDSFFFVFCVCTFVQLCAHEDIVTLSRIRVSFIFFSLYLLRNNFASNIYIIRSGHTPIQDLHWHINTDSNSK